MMFQKLRSRRDFLRYGARTLSTIGAAAAFGKAGLMNALAQSTSDYKAIVCIFLFGGNDSNNMLIPNDTAAYANYQKIRQNLAIPQGSLVAIHDTATNANYGLHPSFAPIAPLYNTSKRLALVANVGTLVQPVPRGSNGLPQFSSVPLPVNLYSHADQQNEWQNGVPQGGTNTGWSGRLADRIAGGSSALVPPCISISGNALQLVGETTQASTVNTSNFGLVAPATDPGSVALQNMLSLSSGVTLIQAAQSSLKDAISVAQAVNTAVAGSASLGVTFANTDIGTQLAQVAKLIQVRSALGASRQIFFCSQGGYDTHSNQLPQQVTLYSNLAAAMAAFDQAMGQLNLQSNVTTFTESDFGRTFQPNGNAGTDHGWGSHQLVMGGAVNGGSLYGTFPNLTPAGSDDSGNRGTWVPTNSQDQYNAAIAKWFGLAAQADLDYVFPNLTKFGYQTPAFI
ncbi:MAG TPA: DUF1501 domain-containing protein [Bryobacteraceae bacterium]|jgi:uncharacterized protein (DUF1501 family)